MLPIVAVLFARRDSIYKSMLDCDVWDEDRDARKWPGGCPVIAHPPCAQWSSLHRFARKDEEQKRLALFAVEQVRKFGGVLEHPYKSSLWDAAKLPKPGRCDEYGGYTVAMPQFWFGHPANKATWFYIVGCPINLLPEVPLKLGRPELCVTTSRGRRTQREMPKRDRDRTYPAMAIWLYEVARRVGKLGFPRA